MEIAKPHIEETNLDWNQWFMERKARLDVQCADRLVETALAAHVAGKEAFAIELLDALWTTNPDRLNEHMGSPIPTEQRIQDWSTVYYLRFPEVMSMREFAAKMRELQGSGAFDF